MVSDTLNHEYKIVSAVSQGELETIVNVFMDEGWEPLGGIAMATSGTRVVYAQAMVRVEKKAALVFAGLNEAWASTLPLGAKDNG